MNLSALLPGLSTEPFTASRRIISPGAWIADVAVDCLAVDHRVRLR